MIDKFGRIVPEPYQPKPGDINTPADKLREMIEAQRQADDQQAIVAFALSHPEYEQSALRAQRLADTLGNRPATAQSLEAAHMMLEAASLPLAELKARMELADEVYQPSDQQPWEGE